VTAPSQESQGRQLLVAAAHRVGAARRATAEPSGSDSPEVEARAADRVIVFSDAVIAIAITLLALALPTPDDKDIASNGQLLAFLGDNWDQYFAFLLSFGIIGSNWAAHRRAFRYVNKLNRQVSGLNMIWLLMMVLTPFAARLLAASGGFGVRFTLYTLIQVIATACLVQTTRQISRENLLCEDAPAPVRHPDNVPALVMIVTFLVSIPVSFAVEDWAFAVWAVIPTATRVMERRVTIGRHAAAAPAAAGRKAA
jgi:uncharacterized membrane protein